ncbi:hypothetical protein GCM10010869_21310 [Mesorhizobium tianshanense]|uniref:Uncharacterized protein n=1 Tax=Mesorhizobium tianshanense TaxID=39844 RepID=A0A562MR05_9HYPH|nr:hypothetical protein IQ26_06713 [Mesorhizobium tianshanense]GLS36542.1 hypothetical protein GCM10010869_21310 [Mesorhizobium tianshanense]
MRFALSRQRNVVAKTTLILAHLRRDVRMLNELARDKLVERGIVGEGHSFRTADGIRHFNAGDQIVFLKNEGALGVKNGLIGRVVEAAPNLITVMVGEGDQRRQVTVESRSYNNLDHGYATTIHKAQGASVRLAIPASFSSPRRPCRQVLRRPPGSRQVPMRRGRRSSS